MYLYLGFFQMTDFVSEIKLFVECIILESIVCPSI